MSDLKYLETSITDLLCGNACVVIPDMGAFLIRQSPAAANPFSGEVRPAGQTLFFNPAITADDGLLASYWREHFGTDYAGASALIAACRQQILDQIRERRNYQLGKLGNFFLSAEGKLLFLPFAGVNLDKKAYGLHPVLLNESQSNNEAVKKPEIHVREESKPYPETEKSPEVEEAEVLGMEVIGRRERRGMLWKVAATICLISLTAAAVYYGQHFLRSHRDVQSAASTHVPVSGSAEDVTKKKSEEAVYKTANRDINAMNAHLKNKTGDVFVCGGTYMDKGLALNECRQWHTFGYPAVLGRKKGSSLVKVVIGRYNTEEEASEWLEALPVISGFHAGVLIAPISIEE